MSNSKEVVYVTRSHKVDPYNTVRRRVPLTPDRCRLCGFSVCERNNLAPYERLDGGTQQRVKQALAEHRKIAHPNYNKPVVRESELPTQWLGNSKPNETYAVGGASVPADLPEWKTDRRALENE